MKKRTLRQLLIATAVTLLNIQVGSAQIHNAVTTDKVAGTYSGIPDATNLGNAVVRFGSGEMKAMVWDGGVPTFAWEFNGSNNKIPIEGSNYGTVSDPGYCAQPSRWC